MNYLVNNQRGTPSKIKIHICLPHTHDFIPIQFFDYMINIKSKYPFNLTRSNRLPLDRNRNHLTETALKDKAVSHVLFLDTDIVPPCYDFMDKMVSYDVPIIGLLCTKRTPPHEPIIMKTNAPENEKLNGFWIKYPKGLVEADATGTGCLLVKREVFEKMQQPYFKFHSAYESGKDLSEDVYFLTIAKAIGYKLYVDTEMTCKHLGVYGYGIEDFERGQKDGTK